MFTYVDNIKVPDEDLIKSVYDSLKENPFFNFSNYFLYTCNPLLVKFLQSQFISNNFKYGIQRISAGQSIHIDYKRTTAFNFILETGGTNVATCFWSDLAGSKLLQSVVIGKQKWHKLNVTIPHSVINLTSDRISITAWN
jgi:hypothetical protein